MIDSLLPHPPPGPYAVRLSVTERCQLRCTYCLPSKGCACVREQQRELSHQQMAHLLRTLHQAVGIKRLRLTGGEPLLRRDLSDLVYSLKDCGVEDIALTTNGQLLSRDAHGLAQAGLKRINVSLDSMDAEVFRQVTRGGVLHKTLDGIQAALEAGLRPLKLNMVVLRGANDGDLGAVLRYALSLGCELRFLELMPIGEGSRRFAEEFVSSEEVRDRLVLQGFEFQALAWDFRETSRDWKVTSPEGKTGVCGFVSPTSKPFCDGCRRLRITSDAWLYGCLAKDERHDLRSVLESSDPAAGAAAWKAILVQAMKSKLGDKYVSAIPQMSLVGG